MVKNKRIEEQKKIKEQIEIGIKGTAEIISKALENLRNDIIDGKFGRDILVIARAVKKVEEDAKDSEFILAKITERISTIENSKKRGEAVDV